VLPLSVIEEIRAETGLYERKQSACIDALKIVQRHKGWVDDESVADIAGLLGMTTHEVDSVATFYNLILRRPVGRHVIRICTSVSCWVMGLEAVLAKLEQALGIKPGETTADGRFTLLANQCLGACDHAPVLMIDEDLHRDVNIDNLGALLAKYE